MWSALDLLAQTDDTTNEQSCTGVQVPSGVHTLKRNVTISKNVIIRGSRGTKVTLKFSSDLLPSIDQIAVLSLKNCHQVSIVNIVFEDSPGYIEIVNVTSIHLTRQTLLSDTNVGNFVTIHDNLHTLYRFLIQRAVNVYNFHKVIVEECVFEHNGPASNIKFTNFMRGHSGGLAILLIEYHQCDAKRSSALHTHGSFLGKHRQLHSL